MQSFRLIWNRSEAHPSIITVTTKRTAEISYDPSEEIVRLSNVLNQNNLRWCAEQFVARISSCDDETCKKIWTASTRMVEASNHQCLDLVAYLCKISRNSFQGQRLQHFIQNQKIQDLPAKCVLYGHKVIDCKDLCYQLCDEVERAITSTAVSTELVKASEILQSLKAILFCSSDVYKRILQAEEHLNSMKSSKIKFQLQLALERLTLKEVLE